MSFENEEDEPIGFIRPPDDLRKKVDRTATYVAKNGVAFEEKIKNESSARQAFSFLFPDDQYHAYYLLTLKEKRNSLLNNLDTKLSSTTSNNNNDDEANEQNKKEQVSNEGQTEQVSDNNQDYDNKDNQQTKDENVPKISVKLNEYIQEMTLKLEEPPSLNYLATSAPSLTNLDCDIIKLTAQYIAKYGRSFLLELISRELNNSQFDFLKPQHGQFSYLTNLILQYALIRNQPLDLIEQLTKDATSQKHVIDKIKMRAEWNKMLEVEQKKREEAEEKERILYNHIDWNDFIIVETIDYQPHEHGEYPPTTADQVGTRLLMQQRFEEQNMPEEMDIDMDVESDDASACDDDN